TGPSSGPYQARARRAEARSDDAVGGAAARSVARDGRHEAVPVQAVETRVRACDDRRRPRHVPEQRDLTEEVAARELDRWARVDLNLDTPVFDHVEAVAFVAAAKDRRPRGRRRGDELGSEAFDGYF